MTSWRDHASTRTQHDLDELLGAALGFAQRQLDEHGEFFPFAVAIRADGRTEMIAARPDLANDRPSSDDVISSCLAAVLDKRDEIRAAALISDVHARELLGDAIEVNLEHAEGAALTVLLPYTKRRLRKGTDYGQIRASEGNRRIWKHT